MKNISAPVAVSWQIPALGWAGVALLALSAGCAVWVMRSRAAEATAPAQPAQPDRAKAAGCYGYVDVESNVAKLYPLVPGRVVKVLAHDNDVVEKDAPLLQLDDTLAKAKVRQAKADLKAAEEQLEKARFGVKKHAEEVTGQRAVIAGKQAGVEAARQDFNLAKRFADSGTGPKEKARVAEELVQALEQEVKAEEAKLRGLEAFDPTADVRRAEQDVEAKKGQLDEAEFGLRECTLRAPGKGTVLLVKAAVGDVLGPNPREPALMFCPDETRVIRAEVEQEFANRLSVGQTAVIRDDARMPGNWRGKVTRISDWYTHRRSVVQEPLQFNDVRTLECILAIEPNEKAPPLRIGQRVRVTLESGN